VTVQIWQPLATKPSERYGGLIRLVPGGSVVVAGLARADRVVDHVPVLAWVRTRFYEIEEAALVAIRDRLFPTDGLRSVSDLVPFSATPPPVAVVASNTAISPREAFAALLEMSERQTPAAARQRSVMRTLSQLLPDEARVLLALSDGGQRAVLQVHDGDDHLVQNRSSVGRAAKVHANDLTSTYVTHLLELGLAELVPYEGRSFYEWEMLETETEVRDVLGRYDHRKLKKPKVTRQILRLSPAGGAFCDLCIPS